MRSKLIITAAIAATLGVASLQASAANTDPTLGVASLQASAANTDPSEHAEAMATRSAKITPTRAVAIAEHGGGTAYGFGMESERSGHWYEVDVLRHGQPTIVRIDSNNGHVLGSSRAHGEDAAGAHALDGSSLKLDVAIATAERKGKGPAMEATATGSGAHAAVIVDVAVAHGIHHYRVSSQGGQMHVARIARDPTE